MIINGSEWDPNFGPTYTPEELLEMGVFGGKYFNDIKDKYPKDIFKNAKMVNRNEKQNKELNYFGVLAGQPLSTWKEKGWISEHDSHGWLEWYFNYYYGRRIPEEDSRQIRRWYLTVSRHTGQIKSVKDLTPKRGQALLQWSWNYKEKISKEIIERNINHLYKMSQNK